MDFINLILMIIAIELIFNALILTIIKEQLNEIIKGIDYLLNTHKKE